MSASARTSDVPLGKISREAYRTWATSQPGRFERIEGEIVAMAAERVVHSRIKAAVWLALRRAIALAGIECEALADGVTIETGESDFEPDASVNGGSRMADDAIAAPNPVVVVEVSSPSTATKDSTMKLAGYFEVASIEHYLIVNPSKRQVIHHRRQPDGIATRILTAGEIALTPPGIVITVAEIYAD